MSLTAEADQSPLVQSTNAAIDTAFRVSGLPVPSCSEQSGTAIVKLSDNSLTLWHNKVDDSLVVLCDMTVYPFENGDSRRPLGIVDTEALADRFPKVLKEMRKVCVKRIARWSSLKVQQIHRELSDSHVRHGTREVDVATFDTAAQEQQWPFSVEQTIREVRLHMRGDRQICQTEVGKAGSVRLYSLRADDFALDGVEEGDWPDEEHSDLWQPVLIDIETQRLNELVRRSLTWVAEPHLKDSSSDGHGAIQFIAGPGLVRRESILTIPWKELLSHPDVRCTWEMSSAVIAAETRDPDVDGMSWQARLRLQASVPPPAPSVPGKQEDN